METTEIILLARIRELERSESALWARVNVLLKENAELQKQIAEVGECDEE